MTQKRSSEEVLNGSVADLDMLKAEEAELISRYREVCERFLLSGIEGQAAIDRSSVLIRLHGDESGKLVDWATLIRYKQCADEAEMWSQRATEAAAESDVLRDKIRTVQAALRNFRFDTAMDAVPVH